MSTRNEEPACEPAHYLPLSPAFFPILVGVFLVLLVLLQLGVLRYAYIYGPGTWSPDGPGRRPCVHVDAAAQAAANALSRGEPGVYNVGEDDPTLSSEKAKQLLGFDPDFRLTL